MTGKNKPAHLAAHLHFLSMQKPYKKLQKSSQTNTQRHVNGQTTTEKEGRRHNNVYKK
jgi:ribosomal protein L2